MVRRYWDRTSGPCRVSGRGALGEVPAVDNCLTCSRRRGNGNACECDRPILGNCAPCSAPLNLGALARAESDRRKVKLRRPGDYRSRGRRRHALRVSLARLLVSRCRSINAADRFGSIVTHGPSPSSLAGGYAVRLDLSVRQRTWACAIESVRVEQKGSVPGHGISPVRADVVHQGCLGARTVDSPRRVSTAYARTKWKCPNRSRTGHDQSGLARARIFQLYSPRCLPVPAWMLSDCCRSRRGFGLRDLDVPITGTGGEFETPLIEDRDGAASVANQLPAL